MNLLFSYRDIQVQGQHGVNIKILLHEHAARAHCTVFFLLYGNSNEKHDSICLLSPHQDYDAMVKLVQTLEMLPTCDLATQPMIQFHYAFALNRYAAAGFKLRCGGEPVHAKLLLLQPTTEGYIQQQWTATVTQFSGSFAEQSMTM